MPVRRSLARPLSLLVYVVVSCSCDPVDVALNKPIDANVTCGYASPERFLSHMYATGYYRCPRRREGGGTLSDTAIRPFVCPSPRRAAALGYRHAGCLQHSQAIRPSLCPSP